jgi:hypothetical protein
MRVFRNKADGTYRLVEDNGYGAPEAEVVFSSEPIDYTTLGSFEEVTFSPSAGNHSDIDAQGLRVHVNTHTLTVRDAEGENILTVYDRKQEPEVYRARASAYKALAEFRESEDELQKANKTQALARANADALRDAGSFHTHDPGERLAKAGYKIVKVN